MRLLQNFLTLLAPDSCVACGTEPDSICGDCALVVHYPDRCYVCRKPSLGSVTCSACKRKSCITAMYIGAPYDGYVKDLVWRMKYGSSRSTVGVIGRLLSERLPFLNADDVLVTHAPTTPSRMRERSFDQAKLLAKRVAKSKGIMYAPLLIRKTQFHQVGSTGKSRRLHMENAFETKYDVLFRGKTVVLVDDVLTTGATIESAARALKKSGAKRVIGVVFARAE